MKAKQKIIAIVIITFSFPFFKENNILGQNSPKDSSKPKIPSQNVITDHIPPSRFSKGTLVKWKGQDKWNTGVIIDLKGDKDSCLVKCDKDGSAVVLPYSILYRKSDKIK